MPGITAALSFAGFIDENANMVYFFRTLRYG